jgi:hypothetical protein
LRGADAVRRYLALAAAVLGLLAGAAVTVASPATASVPTIAVDGSSPGRTFDGVGALSAGATSRLLVDYPEPQRSQILDYLFKPGYGAALHVLKVEIGGDTNSTDGAEASHMRTPDAVDCNRGYEWWLMEQAKARNPNIKLSALEWGAPSWVGNGARTVWTSQNISYLLSWLGCARQHNLTIDYLGGWNEAGFDAGWYAQLRQALDAHGYQDVQIVADDSYDWTGVASAMQSNPDFKQAVSIIGEHYPCSDTCTTPDSVLATGKTIWASEAGSADYNGGATKLAADLNRDYVDGKMTADINWSLEWSAYAGLPFDGNGLLLANTPWSGHYQVGKSIWAMAQTTQFTAAGWRYLDSGSMRIPGGSVVSLRSPNADAWTTVAETTEADQPQQVDLAVSGGLPTGAVHVWATDLRSSNPADWFVQQPDLTPANGQLSATLQPGYVYTFSTATGAGHGTAAAPASAAWPLPYNDGFDEYGSGVSPKYFSDLEGAFETAPCTGRSGGCLRQVVPSRPVTWDGWYDHPATLLGDPTSWGNYQTAVDARLGQSGWVELDGRASGPGDGVSGYHFRVSDTGAWSLYRVDSAGLNNATKQTQLASGTTAVGTQTWHQLALQMRGDQIVALVDGQPLGAAVDSTYSVGQIGLEVSPWASAQFDNLHVNALPAHGEGPELGAISPSPVFISAPGGGTQVNSSVRNPGSTPATDVTATLQAPPGWGLRADQAAPGTLAPGAQAPLSWTLTAPVDASPGTYPAELKVTYQEGGLPWTADASVPVYLEVVPQDRMTATATSAQSGYPAGNAIDGDANTLWHTSWSPRVYPPQSITLALGGDYNVRGLQYLPRQDRNPNGVITSYRLLVSQDGNAFTQVAAGNWPLDGTRKDVNFGSVAARYVRLEADAAGNGYVSAAEINVVATPPNS